MARPPEGPGDQLKFLGVVVLLGLAGIYWLYLHAPRSDELAVREDRLERLESENHRAEIRVGDLDALREELGARRAALRALERAVPSRAEVAALYDDIARITRELDLDLVSLSPRRATREEGEYLYRQRWSMELQGDYHRLGRFLSEVAALDRIVRPGLSSVARPQDGAGDEGDVRAQVELETFVFPPEGESEPDSGARAEGLRPLAAEAPGPAAREPFVYPLGGRRDPFRSPAERGGTGPSFESLSLAGIIYAPGSGSVAVVVSRPSGRRYRLRVGDRIGDARLVDVGPHRAVFQVTTSGTARRAVLRPRGSQGRGTAGMREGRP